MNEESKQSTFIKFSKEDYKKDAMDLFMYGIMKSSENKMGFATLSIKQLLCYSGLGKSMTYKVEKSIKNLIEQELIEIYSDVNLNETIDISEVKSSEVIYIKVNENELAKDQFVQIFTSEIYKFMSEKMKSTKASLFKQFLYIMKFVNQGKEYRKISFPNISTIANETGVSDRSVKNYTSILEEHGFIYSNILIIGNEKIKKIYSRVEHSSDVDEAIAECISNKTKNIKTLKSHMSKSVLPRLIPESRILEKSKSENNLDKKVTDAFEKYNGELNKNSVAKLEIYQKQEGIDVLVKEIHIVMENKQGLENPTGFMLKQLYEKGLKEARYQIKRSEELSLRDDKMSYPEFDYKKHLKKRKGIENQKSIKDEMETLLSGKL